MNEAEDIARAVERILAAQRAGAVRDWLLGGFPGGFAIKVHLPHERRDVEARGATIGAAVDALIVELAKGRPEA